ncbi:MAG: hypothetical protein WBX25_21245 [Rhodomicrobium sp.]
MAERAPIAEIVNSFSISNAMLIHALEQSGAIADFDFDFDFDFAKQLREIAEAEEREAPKRGKKRQKPEFHILRHVALLIEMRREQPPRRRQTPAKTRRQLLMAPSP